MMRAAAIDHSSALLQSDFGRSKPYWTTVEKMTITPSSFSATSQTSACCVNDPVKSPARAATSRALRDADCRLRRARDKCPPIRDPGSAAIVGHHVGLMGIVLLDMSMSLDGFIAGPDGDVERLHEWLFTGETASREKTSSRELKVAAAKPSAKKTAAKKTTAAGGHGKAKDLAAGYFAQQPADKRALLEKLRALVMKAVPDAKVSIKWGVPFYQRNGKNVCALAAFNEHVGINFFAPPELLIDA